MVVEVPRIVGPIPSSVSDRHRSDPLRLLGASGSVSPLQFCSVKGFYFLNIRFKKKTERNNVETEERR